MAKKRDRRGRESTGEDRSFLSGVIDPRAFEAERNGFASQEPDMYRSEGVIEEWEDDQKTAPDLFADASDEGQMQASGGHTQQLDGETPGRPLPGIRRR
jgi:hypothetical protein